MRRVQNSYATDSANSSSGPATRVGAGERGGQAAEAGGEPKPGLLGLRVRRRVAAGPRSKGAAVGPGHGRLWQPVARWSHAGPRGRPDPPCRGLVAEGAECCVGSSARLGRGTRSSFAPTARLSRPRRGQEALAGAHSPARFWASRPGAPPRRVPPRPSGHRRCRAAPAPRSSRGCRDSDPRGPRGGRPRRRRGRGTRRNPMQATALPGAWILVYWKKALSGGPSGARSVSWPQIRDRPSSFTPRIFGAPKT